MIMMKRIIFYQKTNTIAEAIKQSIRDKTRIEIEWISSSSQLNPILMLSKARPLVVVTELEALISKKVIARDLRRNLPIPLHLVCCIEEHELSLIQQKKWIGDWLYTIKDKDLSSLTGQLLALTEELQEGQLLSGVDWIKECEISFPLFLQSHTHHSAMIECSVLLPPEMKLDNNFPIKIDHFFASSHTIKGNPSLSTRSHLPYTFNVNFSYGEELSGSDELEKFIENSTYDLNEFGINESVFAILDKILIPTKYSLLVKEENNDAAKSEEPIDSKKEKIKNLSRALAFKAVFKATNQLDVISIYQSEMTVNEHATDANYIIRRIPQIINPADDVLKDRPSIIAIEYSRENNFQRIKELVKATTQVLDYFPYFIIFNYREMPIESLRDKLEYHFVISAEFKLEHKFIMKVLDVYRQKSHLKIRKRAERNFKELLDSHPEYYSIGDEKTFLPMFYGDPRKSNFYWPQKHFAKIKRLGPFSVTFETNLDLSVGSIISINSPRQMQLYILKHIKADNSFIGLIHLLTESERSSYINYLDELESVTSAVNKI